MKVRGRTPVVNQRVLRLDPSRTGLLRKRLASELRKRFARLKLAVVNLVLRDDAFGLRRPTLVTANEDWRGRPDAEKVKAFQAWLRKQVDREILDEDLWERYAHEGFLKGAGRAFDDVRRKRPESLGESLDFYRGTREEFLRSSFARPVAIEKVKLLAGRSYSDLEGVTATMSTRMTRTLTDGLVLGESPRDIARDLADEVDGIGRARAETIARTEIIRAHADGQLEALELLGVEEVGVEVEWIVTPDDKLCPECAAMEGAVFTIAEARGLIPRHPNCRCTFAPAGVGEK